MPATLEPKVEGSVMEATAVLTELYLSFNCRNLYGLWRRAGVPPACFRARRRLGIYWQGHVFT